MLQYSRQCFPVDSTYGTTWSHTLTYYTVMLARGGAPTIAFTYDSANPSQSVAITVAAIRPNSRSCKGWRSGTRPDLDANSGWRRLAIPSSILARRPACPRLRHFPLPSLESSCVCQVLQIGTLLDRAMSGHPAGAARRRHPLRRNGAQRARARRQARRSFPCARAPFWHLPQTATGGPAG